MGPPNQTSDSSTTSKETSTAEVLESAGLSTSVCTTEPHSGEVKESVTKLSVTTAVGELTSTPDTPSTQADKVVIVRPPTAAAYKMLVVLIQDKMVAWGF